jgi:hypothetical protein
MEALLVLIAVAVLIEAVWEALKPVFGKLVDKLQERGVPVDRIVSLVIALVVCLGIGARVDLFALLGLSLCVPYLGLVLTAIILARGSNFVHDLLGALDGVRQGNGGCN